MVKTCSLLIGLGMLCVAATTALAQHPDELEMVHGDVAYRGPDGVIELGPPPSSYSAEYHELGTEYHEAGPACASCDSDDPWSWAHWWHSSCDMVQHFSYFPQSNGYYYFRPYHYQHIKEQANVAAHWGEDPRNPYANDIFDRVYAQLEAERVEPSAEELPEPVRPDSSPSDLDESVPEMEEPDEDLFGPDEADIDQGAGFDSGPHDLGLIRLEGPRVPPRPRVTLRFVTQDESE